MNENPFDKIEQILGTRHASLAQKLSDATGEHVTKGRVFQWEQTRIPSEWCFEIEEALSGQITCEEMRPDLKWYVVRKSQRAKRRNCKGAA
jgi:DNA-binding transcriptional regulator YdaS (Cro superfamily)